MVTAASDSALFSPRSQSRRRRAAHESPRAARPSRVDRWQRLDSDSELRRPVLDLITVLAVSLLAIGALYYVASAGSMSVVAAWSAALLSLVVALVAMLALVALVELAWADLRHWMAETLACTIDAYTAEQPVAAGGELRVRLVFRGRGRVEDFRAHLICDANETSETSGDERVAHLFRRELAASHDIDLGAGPGWDVVLSTNLPADMPASYEPHLDEEIDDLEEAIASGGIDSLLYGMQPPAPVAPVAERSDPQPIEPAREVRWRLVVEGRAAGWIAFERAFRIRVKS